MKPFNSIGGDELYALQWGIDYPLSGYLAGRARGGYHVRALEDAWSETFHVKHAIAVNSATSGLLAAAFAIDLKTGDQFVCPAMTMSATAAAPMFTGATPVFVDVDVEDFSIPCSDLPYGKPVFVTNLFGYPADLHRMRQWCDRYKEYMIEDNAQSPFAMEFGKYAGTIGHIGVFSLNIHKPLQCGEGGVIVTDDDELALRMRAFINHGEHVSGRVGLNLRMAELCAMVAVEQLKRGHEITDDRIEQACAILDAIGDIPGIKGPADRAACKNVFYTIPFLIDGDRKAFCDIVRDEGFPIVEGYVEPLYRMPAFSRFARPCPVAEDLHDRRLFYFENCAWNLTPDEIRQMGYAFRRAAEAILPK